MTTTELRLKPSISTNSWLRVLSRSSLLPFDPVCRALPMASISSMNTIALPAARARSNNARTRLAPTPTYVSTKSEPDIA
jgi:hypothetical protein